MLSAKHTITFSPIFASRELYARVKGSPLGSRIARGTFWSLTGSILSRGLGLLSAVLVGRILGREGFGELGIIQNTLGMFGTLAGLGMGLTANKYIAELKRSDPARAGRILGFASATSWVSSGLLAALLLAAAPWLAASTLAAPHLGRSLQVGALLMFLSGINGAQTGALAGFEAFKSIAWINLVSGIVAFPLTVLGASQWGIVGAVWGLVGGQLVNCVLCYLRLRAEAEPFEIRYGFAGARSEWRLFWSFSLPAVLAGVLNSVVAWGASALVVNQVGGYSDMGVYNAAVRVKQIPELLLTMLIAPMVPILSEAFGRGDFKTFQRTLLFNFFLATLLIVPVSLVQAAAPSLTLMLFGAGFDGHPGLVVWLMLHSVLYALLFPMGSVLVSMGKMWFSWGVNLLFAIIFMIAAWLLVPAYGAAGYAAAMAVAYLLSNIPCVVLLYREIPSVMSFVSWGRVAVIAGILFVTCAMVIRPLPLLWSASGGFLAASVFILAKCGSYSRLMQKLDQPGAAAASPSES